VEMTLGINNIESGVIPEGWCVKPLGELAELTSSKRIFESDYVSFGVLFFRGKEISMLIKGETIADPCFISESRFDSIKNKFGAPARGDILITAVGTLGNVYLVDMDEPFYFKDGNLIWLRNIQGVDPKFLEIQLSRAKFAILDGAIGSSQKALTMAVLRKLPVTIPPSLEQRFIATALSDVDALLDSLDRLIAKKRDLKQAAMQQLLTGQTRLPGFSGEWVLKRLGDVLQIQKGQLITSSTLKPGSIPVIAGGKQPAYFHAFPNRLGRTITISASGASAGYVALYDEPIFASDCSTISESTAYSLDYVFYQLLLNQKAIYKAQTGGAQPHIHAKDLIPIQIVFPSIAEQIAISNVLSQIDAELSILEARRKKTDSLKQGMMQELLTGRTRLV
jgi:type I restriction enzyme S subunit